MTDQKPVLDQPDPSSRDVTRRDVMAMSVAAGIVAATGAPSAQMQVDENDVDVNTPD